MSKHFNEDFEELCRSQCTDLTTNKRLTLKTTYLKLCKSKTQKKKYSTQVEENVIPSQMQDMQQRAYPEYKCSYTRESSYWRKSI